VKWPNVIKAGSISGAITCQTDLFTTCAVIVGKELPKNVPDDSESILPVLWGKESSNDIRNIELRKSGK